MRSVFEETFVSLNYVRTCVQNPVQCLSQPRTPLKREESPAGYMALYALINWRFSREGQSYERFLVLGA